jgi:uncharacterized protein YprB with RNaseH-like and TPR domain
MSTLIVDIETVGEVWDDIDDITQDALTRWAHKTASTDTDLVAMLNDIKNSLGFSPVTGHIVALGVYDIERQQGTVYYEVDDSTADERVGAFWYRARTEASMLAEFWDGVQTYDTVVTFNGRNFDLPFILHRSVANAVIPTIDLMRYRYLTQQVPPYHIDLADQLTFYGAMGKRPGLHLFCRTYGIESPKSHGVSGDDVARLYAERHCREIAAYNSYDLIATAELYTVWQKYLAPPAFRRERSDIDFIP